MIASFLVSIAAAAAMNQPSVAECKYDDGSVARSQVNAKGGWVCVWDAKHQGNGRGHSFIAKSKRGEDPRIVRISHRAAHMLTH